MASIPPPATQGSAPDRSWRSKISLDVVAAMLKRKNPRSQSSAESEEPRKSTAMSDLKKDEDKVGESEVDVRPMRSNTTSCEEGSLEAVTPPDAPRNPMESAGEGGVNFTSLKWW